MKIRVLLADDETAFADALAERLRLRDFETEVVSSGTGALEIINEKEIDVAVLDVQMPGLTGTEVLEKLRAVCPLVQVILLTGQGTIENAIKGMKLGAFDYLLKPANIDVLSAKIKDAFEMKSNQEEKIKKAEIDAMINRRGW